MQCPILRGSAGSLYHAYIYMLDGFGTVQQSPNPVIWSKSVTPRKAGPSSDHIWRRRDFISFSPTGHITSARLFSPWQSDRELLIELHTGDVIQPRRPTFDAQIPR